ncbi:hypothetical protein V6N13_135375 [Hibiscus sabdariffa]
MRSGGKASILPKNLPGNHNHPALTILGNLDAGKANSKAKSRVGFKFNKSLKSNVIKGLQVQKKLYTWLSVEDWVHAMSYHIDSIAQCLEVNATDGLHGMEEDDPGLDHEQIASADHEIDNGLVNIVHGLVESTENVGLLTLSGGLLSN